MARSEPQCRFRNLVGRPVKIVGFRKSMPPVSGKVPGFADRLESGTEALRAYEAQD